MREDESVIWVVSLFLHVVNFGLPEKSLMRYWGEVDVMSMVLSK